jgi:hypothetical protein
MTEERLQFRTRDAETFESARSSATEAVQRRAPLTQAEVAAGWTEDPLSGLRLNTVTGGWDDSLFVHVAPRRPS